MSASVDWMTMNFQRPSRKLLSDRDVQRVPADSGNTRAMLMQEMPLYRDWRLTVIDRLNELMQLRDNWDSYGARAPGRLSIAALYSVLNSVMSSDTPPPSIVPSPHGHLQAEWHAGDIDLEIEVISLTNVVASYSNPDALSWDDRTFSLDFTDLVAAVQSLRHR